MIDVIQLLNRSPSPLDVQMIDDEEGLFDTGDYLGIYDRSGRLLLAVQLCDVLDANGERIEP